MQARLTLVYLYSLSWGVLQEAITTTRYAPTGERFNYPVVLNVIQSTFAAAMGFGYLYFSTPRGQKMPAVFPNRRILIPLFLVSICTSLASPFGYASLAHIDYLTFILAKSCKLLPVMFLHLTIFRKRYPLYKYGVVLLVTLGVATFTLHHPGTSKKMMSSTKSSSSLYGILLLSVNLLLDGLTNTTQDHIFACPHLYTRFGGPQMMVSQNLLSTALSCLYLLVMAYLGGFLFSTPTTTTTPPEFSSAISFMSRHPDSLKNVLGFATCGAIGQVFIFYTLSRFSSLLLVTVTVTRKMLTMLLSVFWFGHSLYLGQWAGVGLVFGGVAAEAVVQKKEKERKTAKV